MSVFFSTVFSNLVQDLVQMKNLSQLSIFYQTKKRGQWCRFHFHNMQSPPPFFIKKPQLEMMFAKETEREAYESRYKLSIHKDISNSMKDRLRETGYLVNDD